MLEEDTCAADHGCGAPVVNTESMKSFLLTQHPANTVASAVSRNIVAMNSFASVSRVTGGYQHGCWPSLTSSRIFEVETAAAVALDARNVVTAPTTLSQPQILMEQVAAADAHHRDDGDNYPPRQRVMSAASRSNSNSNSGSSSANGRYRAFPLQSSSESTRTLPSPPPHMMCPVPPASFVIEPPPLLPSLRSQLGLTALYESVSSRRYMAWRASLDLEQLCGKCCAAGTYRAARRSPTAGSLQQQHCYVCPHCNARFLAAAPSRLADTAATVVGAPATVSISGDPQSAWLCVSALHCPYCHVDARPLVDVCATNNPLRRDPRRAALYQQQQQQQWEPELLTPSAVAAVVGDALAASSIDGDDCIGGGAHAQERFLQHHSRMGDSEQSRMDDDNGSGGNNMPHTTPGALLQSFGDVSAGGTGTALSAAASHHRSLHPHLDRAVAVVLPVAAALYSSPPHNRDEEAAAAVANAAALCVFTTTAGPAMIAADVESAGDVSSVSSSNSSKSSSNSNSNGRHLSHYYEEDEEDGDQPTSETAAAALCSSRSERRKRPLTAGDCDDTGGYATTSIADSYGTCVCQIM
jgi:hypothetical protein